MTELLRIENLTVDLPPGADRPHALKGLTLAVNPGEIVCVVGESGSGKSLTAGTILGLLPQGVHASAGRVFWEGQDLLKLAPDALRRLRGQRIGMIFQEPMTALNPLRTIGDQIAVMKSGRVVEEGVCADVFSNPSHPYTQALLAAVPGRRWDPAAVVTRLAA